jgi:hypothetical protein
MPDTDVFLQLEKQLRRSPTPRRTAARGAPDQKAIRRQPPRVTPAGKPPPSPHTQARSSARRAPEKVASKEQLVDEGSEDVTTDATADVTTSLLEGVNKKLWRELIEETETHNSSLRISVKEREQIEDIVRDLKRQYRIKTSMNEIARLGLLFLTQDFRQRGKESIIAEVKTA